MDIRQLRFLTALARERHFARAAETSGITQPTLSARIKQLEDELGVTIVERGQRFQGFTAEGERVLAWARQILADCDAMGHDLAAMKGQLRGRLEIGVIPTALIATTELSHRVRSSHPGITLRYFTMTSRQIIQSLENFDIQLGITYLDNERLGPVRHKPIYREGYTLAARRDLPIEGRSEIGIGEGDIEWAEAAKLPLCLLTPDMQHRRIIDDAFRQVGVKAQPVIETNSISVLLAHAQDGGVAAILSDRQLARLGKTSDLTSRRLIAPEVEHEIGLVALDKSPMSSLAESLWGLF